MSRTAPPATFAAAAALAYTAYLFSPAGPPPNQPVEAHVSAPGPVCQHLAVRLAAKDAIARDVAAGRTSLFDAAARFAWLNTLPPQCPRMGDTDAGYVAAEFGLEAGPGFTDNERAALQVIAWATERTAWMSPERAGEVAGRLRDEFLAARRARSLENLPAVPEATRRDLLNQAASEAGLAQAGAP